MIFQPSQTTYDGKSQRAYIGKCFKCGYVSKEMCNAFRSHGGDDDVYERVIARKFEKKGWKVNKSKLTCPNCAKEARAAQMRYLHAKKGEGMANVVELNTRQMSRDDRQIIFVKLQETYVGETVGYSPGWTDKKVADDLNVPVAWVKLIRTENFGDLESNTEINDRLKEALQFTLQLKEVFAIAAKLADELPAIKQRGEMIENKLHAIEKAFGVK